MKNIEAERIAFEIDAKKAGYDVTRFNDSIPGPLNEYVHYATGDRWTGWLARASFSACIEEGEGDRLLPTAQTTAELIGPKP